VIDHVPRALRRCPPEPFLRRRSGDLGLSRRSIDWLTARGLLIQPVHGVVQRADLPDSVALRCRAVSLVLPPGATVCRTTAAWLHGVDARETGRHLELPTVECAVPVGTTPVRRPGLTCYVSDLRADDLEEVFGIPVTSPGRTACDLARWASPGRGIATLDVMTRAGLIDPEALLREIERWRGDRFVARARHLLANVDPRSESAGESAFRLRLVDAGFPRPELQIPLLDAAGRTVFRLDLGYEKLRWAGEYDGEEYHSGREAEQRDRARRARIDREWRWTLVVVGKALIYGPSMALEFGVGELLGMAPQIRRRAW
jgi:hypothetical protein